MFKVDVMVRPNKDGWWAEITSLPGCFSGGESLEELKQNIHEAIDLHLESMLEDEEKIADELVSGEYELELHIKTFHVAECYNAVCLIKLIH